VLGESSDKDLRGKKMEEVIFAGGERRGRSSTAEVTILIDNAERRLPVDFEEVAIRRRVDRSGQSDYFLNGARVRRRDLLDLLASTGLTTESYAIVTQRDIESIISCSAEQRRQLIEEAAQVRGVKAKRAEAAVKLRELAGNLERLEDLRREIEPRLEAVRSQAEAAREAAIANTRLDLLRGSIVHEEWRESRDQHRRVSSQAQSLERRVEEARAAAAAAEAEFQAWRQEVQAAQDRRLQRQRMVGAIRLELSGAEHEVVLAEERAHSQAALAQAARAEEQDLRRRAETARALQAQLETELAAAEAELGKVPAALPEPAAADTQRATDARRAAEDARQAVVAAQSALAAARSRRQFLEESVGRLESSVVAAEQQLEAAQAAAGDAAARAQRASEAAAEVSRVRAELEGLEALRPAPRGYLKRIGDVILARPGYEAALSAALGALVDAWAAPDERMATAAAGSAGNQTTVFYPSPGAGVLAGSLFDHVRCEPGFEELARRLLGGIVVGTEGGDAQVTLDGVYRSPGVVRAGADPRVQIAVRRRELLDRLAEFEPVAAEAARLDESNRQAQARLGEVRAAAGARPRLDESVRELEQARAAESAETDRLPGLEKASKAADALAARLGREVDEHDRLISEHRSELRRLDSERARWRDRVGDLRRQVTTLRSDLLSLDQAGVARRERADVAERQAQWVEGTLPGLRQVVEEVRARLTAAERESPEEEAELAAGARRLVELEEARVDARLKTGTLEGTLGLLKREAELLAARMEEIRARMPEGLAPEEIPGVKAREREMHQLDRRLREIGPTNPLAEAECAELEERWSTLRTQLDDIAAAREDLEQLVDVLREEEDSRYEAVFGAVAANFQEYFAELSGGGRCTLRHAAGDDGPRTGVEILVQPVKKRLQTVTLLSSGERAMTALALVMALAEVNPSPFTIFDEVDAALDDTNVGRFGDVLQRLGRERQYLVITHNHMTMACAGALYGVHLDDTGCSHLVSVRLEDIRPIPLQPEAKSA